MEEDPFGRPSPLWAKLYLIWFPTFLPRELDMFRRNCILLTSFGRAPSSLSARAVVASGAHPAVQAVPGRSSPEESFTRRLSIFARMAWKCLGGDVSGFVTQNTGASSRFQVHNTVTSQFIVRQSPRSLSWHHDPCRVSRFTRCAAVPKKRKKKKDDEQNSAIDQGFGTLDEGDESGSGFQTFDQGLISDPTWTTRNHLEPATGAHRAAATRQSGSHVRPGVSRYR